MRFLETRVEVPATSRAIGADVRELRLRRRPPLVGYLFFEGLTFTVDADPRSQPSRRA